MVQNNHTQAFSSCCQHLKVRCVLIRLIPYWRKRKKLEQELLRFCETIVKEAIEEKDLHLYIPVNSVSPQ